jgi:N-acyl-D-amino-acid deacylase
MVTWSRDYPEFIGRDISEIALEMGCTQKEAAAKLMPAGAIYFSTDEQDVRRILAYRKAMIGSDGLPHDPHPHPRLWGTFPRVLGHYCRDIGLFSLETAVHKMTGLPAETFRLKGRGGIKEGNIADIVIFDETEIKDVATFQDPQKPACGIDKVIVNGSVAWANGQPTGERTGSVITRSQV